MDVCIHSMIREDFELHHEQHIPSYYIHVCMNCTWNHCMARLKGISVFKISRSVSKHVNDLDMFLISFRDVCRVWLYHNIPKKCSVSSCHGPFSPGWNACQLPIPEKLDPQNGCAVLFGWIPFESHTFRTRIFLFASMAPFATPIASVKKSAVVRHERSQRNRKLYGSKPYCPTQNNLHKYILQKLSTSIAFNVAAYTHHCHHGALPAWLSKFGQK